MSTRTKALLAILLATLLWSTAGLSKIVVRTFDPYFAGFLRFFVATLVILPFLPNTPLFLRDIPFLKSLLSAFQINFDKFLNLELINPFGVWKVVALVTGVEIFGYFLEKTIG